MIFEAIGKHIEIKYNNYALRVLEKALNVSLPKLLGSESMGVNELTYIFWAGLLHENKQATVEEADKIIDMIGIYKASEIISKALDEYFPKSEDDSKNA